MAAHSAQTNRAWVAVHAATLALVLVVLVLAGRGQWFFGDEWDFLLYRGLHEPRWGLWRPHNEHWSTLPILWYRATLSVFGVKTYWPYLVPLFAAHLAVVHLLWRLLNRARVAPPLAAGLALVIGLLGAGWENLTWAFQVGFVGSLAAGLGLLLLVDDEGSRRRVTAVAVGAGASLLLSGISVFLIVAVGVAGWARWGWRKAAAVVAPSAVVYLVWTSTAGRIGLTGETSAYHGGPGDIPRFVWGGLTATLGAPFRNDRVGAVLVVALVAVVGVRVRSWWRRSPDACALALAAPLMFAAIAQGRGVFVSAAAPRYLYLAAAMLIPIVGLALDAVVAPSRRRAAVALVACATLAVVGAAELLDEARVVRARALTLKGQMLAALEVAATEPMINDRPDYAYHRDVRVSELGALASDGHLPAYEPTPRDLAGARLALQVAAVRQAPRARAQTGTCGPVDLHGRNATVAASVDGTPVVFAVRAPTDGVLRLFVPYGTGNAGPREVRVGPDLFVTIRSVLASPLVLQLPPGTHTVCGMEWIQTTP